MSTNKQQLQAALLSLTMSAELMTQTCTDFVQQAQGDNNHQMWHAREKMMLNALFAMLCYKRDQTGHVIDLAQFAQAAGNLDKFYSLRMQHEWPEAISQEVDAYLHSLPDLQQFMSGAHSVAYTQHGYAGMRYYRLFESA